MTACLVALGSNRGDRRETILRAAEALSAGAEIQEIDRSSLYETPPVGGPVGQDPYINAAAILRTQLDAPELLARMQAIEIQFGRTREQRWAARTIDLDLLLFGQQIIATPGLRAPHPRMTFRPFVMEPAVEIAPDWRHPELGATLEELYRQLLNGHQWIRVAGGEAARRSAVEILVELSDQMRPEPPSSANETWLRVHQMEGKSRLQRTGLAPKLQILADSSAEILPAAPCLRLEEDAADHAAAEIAAAVECVWPALG